MSKAPVLIILGSGLYALFTKESSLTENIETSFGTAQVSELKSPTTKRIYIMMRHGKNHSIPPHLINYRANISAAKELGVGHIIATASVGSLSKSYPIGSYVLINQFLDFTKSRASSAFYEKAENFAHTDMTTPYSEEIRKALQKALRSEKATFSSKGTYVCTEGPRFETPAEIRMYRKLGADVVGMTGVPEVVIANELGIPYATLCHVTNMAAGMQSEVSQMEVNLEMKKSIARTRAILEKAIEALAK